MVSDAHSLNWILFLSQRYVNKSRGFMTVPVKQVG